MKKRSKVKVTDAQGKQKAALKAETTISSPADVDIDPEIEKPILAITVSNPFKKILYWLDQIRRHQTTTLAFKLSIPLIALPVLVLAIFQMGKSAGITLQKSQVLPTPNVDLTDSKQSVEISRAGTLKIAKGTTQTRYLLQLRNGEIVNLAIPANIDLTKYADKQVLITGIQNKATGVITVVDIAEIEVLKSTPIVQNSPLLTPPPSESTSSGTP